MRYAQGGGLTVERRKFRERIRFQAGERFARGEKNAAIAKKLRVSERSDDDHLEHILRRGLRHIQHRPALIDGCLTGTGLELTRRPATPQKDR
ncbi:hypothetical protein ACF1FC_21880 [Streptomyces sp. NPDC014344]|uniref:hypothetical protein n=1 Tax=Streptomyces sp. NPDC014344 TaxID=3364871 RepID=UPI0036F79F35